MTNYAKQIISNEDCNPIIDILEIIQKKSNYGEELSKLSSAEKTIYLIGDIEGEVNNGGFSQYFFNSCKRYTKSDP